MSLKRSAKPSRKRRKASAPPTKQELWDARETAWAAFDQAADNYIANQNAQNALALAIALRAHNAADRAWQQWVFDNTP